MKNDNYCQSEWPDSVLGLSTFANLHFYQTISTCLELAALDSIILCSSSSSKIILESIVADICVSDLLNVRSMVE